MVEVISHPSSRGCCKVNVFVSVSFRSARAAVNVNVSTCSVPLPPPRNYTELVTWSAGTETDALSQLVTGGIFHVQKNAICW